MKLNQIQDAKRGKEDWNVIIQVLMTSIAQDCQKNWRWELASVIAWEIKKNAEMS